MKEHEVKLDLTIKTMKLKFNFQFKRKVLGVSTWFIIFLANVNAYTHVYIYYNKQKIK